MVDRDYQLKDVLDTYRRDGSMIREKSRVLLEEGLDKIYPRLVDPDIPTSAFMELMKFLAEIGDMKPKANTQQQNSGPGFSITINIPQPDGKPPVVIEGHSTPVRSEDGEMVETMALPEMDELPAPPVNFNTIDFQFNHDLSAGVGAYDDGDDE